MAKSSPFSGLKLTEQAAPTKEGLDQRLFSAPTPPASTKPAVPLGGVATAPRSAEAPSREQATTQVAGKPASQETRKAAETGFDLNEKPYQKDSFVFTMAEFEALEDLKIALRRTHGLGATKNDLIRCGLQHLVEDYRQRGEASLAVRRLRTKRSR